MILWNSWIFYFSFLILTIKATRILDASSLIPCMDNSALTAKTFKVSFNPDTGALSYNLDLDTTINGYVNAKVEVLAYGFTIIEKTIDMCSLSFKQFCPLYSGEVIVDSVETISKKYVDMLPGIAFTVPDIDAYVKVTVYNSTTKEDLACMAAYFTNGKTVSHVGAKWATAVVAGLGLLASAVLSTFGNSNAASHISVNALSLFTYFQAVVLVAMEHVEQVPPIASAWAENLAWSMGLIRTEFMQKIFRWYIQATGGDPTLYLKSTTSELAILVQKRIINYLQKRAPMLVVNSSSSLRVLRGIKRIGFNQDIEVTSIVVTGFTFFIICGYALCLVIIVSKIILELLIKTKLIKNQNLAIYFRNNYWSILKGALLRYISIGFVQLTVFSLWEFTQNDSPAVIVLAVLFLLLSVGVLGWATFRCWKFGKSSVMNYNNPAAILYGDQKVLDKYGFAYTMYNANTYWWSVVYFAYILVKAIFIGLCQSSGKTQSLVIFIVDLIYLVGLIKYKPYLDKSTNVLNIIIGTVITLNSFMFMFFSNLFGQPQAVASIMGWVFFILNAAFSLILLIIIIVYICQATLSKVPDSRFRRAGDDRTSFQRNSTMILNDDEKYGDNFANSNPSLLNTPNPGAEELLDLGNVAKHHTANWENEIYKLKDMVDSKGEFIDVSEEGLQLKSKNTIDKLRSSTSLTSNQYQGINDDDEPIQMVKPSFGSKLANTIFKRTPSNAGNTPNNGQGLNSLTRKLSAIKISRNNSKIAKRDVTAPEHEHAKFGGNGSTTHYGGYNSLPLASNPGSPNINHQRTVSQTPITSPNADYSFNFVDNSESQANQVSYNTTKPTMGMDVTNASNGNNGNNDGTNSPELGITRNFNDEYSDLEDSEADLVHHR